MSDKLITALKALCLKHRRGRDNSLWVFSSTDNRCYNYNSKYLFEYVVKNLPNINAKYVMNDPVKAAELKERFGEERVIDTTTSKGIKTALNAGVWFTSAGLPVYGTGLLKDRIVVNLWHGVPLKKIALCDPALGRAGRIYFKSIFSKNYTHILTTSEALRGIMAESFDVAPSVIKVWGQPRNDALFYENDREKILSELYGGLPEYRAAILYAPTFRENDPVKLFPFDDMDYEALEAFLEEQKLMIFVRCHISEKGEKNLPESGRVRFINEDKVDDIMEILNIFDMLITDYSSIYIDYLLTERPIVFLPYDYEQYMSGRGMNFDYKEVTPGPEPDSFKAFCENVKSLLSDGDEFSEQRKAANRFFNQIRGPVSAAICERVLKESSK